MSFRHRFLERSINHASLHNRFTEEDLMWRRREQERDGTDDRQPRRDRSRSLDKRRHRRSPSPSSSEDDNDEKKKKNKIEVDFGPPLPSNLGVNADRWDHSCFMERYPKEYEKQIQQLKHRHSTTTSEDEEKKKQKKKKKKEKKKKKHSSKRKHRSRS